MSNHMEAAPADFAEGIRGKILWHNEYRSQKMYLGFKQGTTGKFGNTFFPGAFDPNSAPAPFHNYTCDGCHVRNGSGVPINTKNQLDPALQEFMTATYSPYQNPDGIDYTFTGHIRPMKLVFFDTNRITTAMDESVYSKPLTLLGSGPGPSPHYYNNKIMNFYGDSFHVVNANSVYKYAYSFDWIYGPADASRMVVNTPRINFELYNKTYQPLKILLGVFNTPSPCPPIASMPMSGVSSSAWPANCNDISGDAIATAIENGTVGVMLLNGRRLGNLGAIEAIPNGGTATPPPAMSIRGFQQSQITALTAALAGTPMTVPMTAATTMAGGIVWNSGTRGGVGGDQKLACTSGSLTDCYIGRFGWLGDRVSLEDQVANAAFVEMNMTTKQGYNQLYPNGNASPIRYFFPNCGPADVTCNASGGNGDLLESDVDRMADYARWIGSPTRSEFVVSLPDVIGGETIFNNLKCNLCHVTSKISFDPNDTMMTPAYRNRLAVAPPASPFLSYLGTDLLMHDMGYLSQVGNPGVLSIRDPNTGLVYDGTCAWISPRVPCNNYIGYVQKIRTPALKGLRFNRFVTDSYLNTIPATPPNPACDFLLHDGRACDAIEAAFLHDGPEIKALNVIGAKGSGGLNDLTPDQLRQLRAFLYSL
jgi:Di-haem oxidoreductase, putative peroxidase